MARCKALKAREESEECVWETKQKGSGSKEKAGREKNDRRRGRGGHLGDQDGSLDARDESRGDDDVNLKFACEVSTCHVLTVTAWHSDSGLVNGLGSTQGPSRNTIDLFLG
eukprot:1208960-Rhodomonas_salina.2